MRDEQQRAIPVGKEVLVPLKRIKIAMIGRLVEQQQFRFQRQRAAEQRATLEAAGQRIEFAVGRQIETGDQRIDARIELPAVFVVEDVLQIAEAIEIVRIFVQEGMVRSAGGRGGKGWVRKGRNGGAREE